MKVLRNKSTTASLVLIGVALAAVGGTGHSFIGMPLWKAMLSLGIGSWLLYNAANIPRQF